MKRKLINSTPAERKKILHYLKTERKLSKKFGTAENRLSYKKISFIRGAHFKSKMDKKQTIRFAEKIMYRDENRRKHPIVWYMQISNFLKNCGDEVWEEITREYPFQE